MSAEHEKRQFPWMMALPLILAVGLAGLFLGGLFRENPDELPSTMIGRPAQALTVGQLGDLPLLTPEALMAPEVKLVNFWASWCAPCRAEAAQLERLAEMGIKIYGVNYKDPPENALGFLRELGNPFTAIGTDQSGRTAIDWGVYGVPETFVIDAQGRIVDRLAGPILERNFESGIMASLRKAGWTE